MKRKFTRKVFTLDSGCIGINIAPRAKIEEFKEQFDFVEILKQRLQRVAIEEQNGEMKVYITIF